MRFYEIKYLLPINLAPEEQKEISEKMVLLLQNQGAKMIKKEEVIKQQLAYPIKKQSAAFLGNLSFHLDPQKLTEFEAGLKDEKKFLRFFLLLKQPVKEKLAEPAESKEEKETGKVELQEIDKKLKDIFGE